MPSYHYISSGLWNDEALEGLPFEGVGFFAYLFSNPRMRPSGIYRVTDAELVLATGLPLGRVRRYLTELMRRGRIVRDRAWLFVRGVFKRRPKNQPTC